jgi:hypothetical protein
MLRRMTHLIAILALTAVLAHAQRAANLPTEFDMYCTGVVTSQAVPHDTYVISGVESDQYIVYSQGQFVFINKGARQGVKVGDEFLVSRPESDPVGVPWITWQVSLSRAMGTTYADLGRLRVTSVQANTAVALIVKACDYIQRGDIVQAFTARPAPQYKPKAALDLFAAPSGKAKAMIVYGLHFGSVAGAGNIVYVNLGAKQGVQVGTYFRIFTYQDARHDVVYAAPRTEYMEFGFGSTPKPYTWADLPRDILGEGIVVRVGPNASTVLITASKRDIYAGDYVEVE